MNSWRPVNITPITALPEGCDQFEVLGPDGSTVHGGPFTKGFAEEVAQALNQRDLLKTLGYSLAGAA